MRKVAVTLTLLMLPPAGFAADVERLRGESVPDATSLRWLSKMAASTDLLYEFVVARLVDVGELDEPTARVTVTYLADLHGAWTQEKRSAEARIACEHGYSRSTTDAEAIRHRDLVDVIRRNIDEKHLTLASADLGDAFDAVAAAIRELKSGILVERVPSSEVYRDAPPGQALTDLAYFCNARIG